MRHLRMRPRVAGTTLGPRDRPHRRQLVGQPHRQRQVPVSELPCPNPEPQSPVRPNGTYDRRTSAPGGTGRRNGFRCRRLRVWGFESPGAHVTAVAEMSVEVEHHFDAPAEAVFALLTELDPSAAALPTRAWDELPADALRAGPGRRGPLHHLARRQPAHRHARGPAGSSVTAPGLRPEAGPVRGTPGRGG